VEFLFKLCRNIHSETTWPPCCHSARNEAILPELGPGKFKEITKVQMKLKKIPANLMKCQMKKV